jgi:UDP-glucose 4-epimerase
MHGLAAVSLRYFNVAGAHRCADGRWLGERHTVKTHLIPNILTAATRDSGEVTIYGDNYPTTDGTCVRDYIHVADLAAAHVLALGACQPGWHVVYNLGSGTGFTNREVVAACREVTGRPLPVKVADRRAGDPAVLVASHECIAGDLGWRPERGLSVMVADAWAFTRSQAA